MTVIAVCLMLLSAQDDSRAENTSAFINTISSSFRTIKGINFDDSLTSAQKHERTGPLLEQAVRAHQRDRVSVLWKIVNVQPQGRNLHRVTLNYWGRSDDPETPEGVLRNNLEIWVDIRLDDDDATDWGKDTIVEMRGTLNVQARQADDPFRESPRTTLFLKFKGIRAGGNTYSLHAYIDRFTLALYEGDD